MQKNKIPRIIHYFWFGHGEKPAIFYKCLESWKKYCPDFEIKEWNEENFDYKSSIYANEAYEQKKFAYVSDYARFYILEKYGGVYLDIDVEIIKPIDDLLKYTSFCGFEYNSYLVNPGLIMGSVPHGSFVAKVLDYYNSLDKFVFGTHTVCTISTSILEKDFKLQPENFSNIQQLNGVFVFPPDFFCAYDQLSKKVLKTKNTFSIHHYNASWFGVKDKTMNFFRRILYKMLGKNNYENLKKLLKRKRRKDTL